MTHHTGPGRRKRGRMSQSALAALGALVLALAVGACGSS